MAEDRPVRDEDAFDVPALDAWLREVHLDGDGGWRMPLPAGLPHVRQFSGGASNLTYLLRYDDRDLILRRPPAGTKASSAHDMAREYRIQAALKPVFPYVPQVIALCTDPAVLGSDFYVMERVEGVIPRTTMPSAIGTDPALMRALGERFVDLLVELHAVDPAAAGLGDLGRGAGYVERQVNGWSERYMRAKTWNVPSFKRVIAWLEERRPGDTRICLIHNDFRLDNLVLDPADPLNVRAVLDWELATLGDPLMDLGSSLAYWIEPDDGRGAQQFRRQPSNQPGMPTRREIVTRYCAATGLDPGDWPFYEVFGMFRLAGIAQQIYYRYHHRQTTNPAFRRYWLAAHVLERRCRRVIRATG
ncbi:phosphotransferase family protein [Conexibacter sp. CPCC 206217]|uniref:phosphotransferase family protein n=1 Tax=Conexibacter sp. CPCC 206217 TaxID=3064574 RepID=UPI00271CE526|nr:phosphotransferase family protein [Conexibacter sp. CPCC 206217]MDO8214030.1 phosphotransferase family protein [Conexibacter sp. CPCC 206217]